jgi:hypothetical protein
MPYVPPHLRGSNGQASTEDSSAAVARSASSDNLRESGSRGGGGWGRDSDSGPPRRPNIPRTPSHGQIDSRGSSRRSQQPVEAVIGRWQPSARVQALDKAQVADIRQRLNVDVTVPEGEPETWAPIESFKDMVRFRPTAAAPNSTCPGGPPQPAAVTRPNVAVVYSA